MLYEGDMDKKTIWTCLGNTVDQLNEKTLQDLINNVTNFSAKGDLLAVLWLRESVDWIENVESLKEMGSYMGPEWMLDTDVVQCGSNNLGVFKRV